MSARNPFLLQSIIEDAIIDFFRRMHIYSRDTSAFIVESTITVDGHFSAHALAVEIERVVDEALGEKP